MWWFQFLKNHVTLVSKYICTHTTLCLIFMILVSLENVKKYSHVVARLPQRLKSTLFEIFSTLRVPFGHPPFEKISNNVDFSLWGKQCICPAKMRPKLWKSHIVRKEGRMRGSRELFRLSRCDGSMNERPLQRLKYCSNRSKLDCCCCDTAFIW